MKQTIVVPLILISCFRATSQISEDSAKRYYLNEIKPNLENTLKNDTIKVKFIIWKSVDSAGKGPAWVENGWAVYENKPREDPWNILIDSKGNQITHYSTFRH